MNCTAKTDMRRIRDFIAGMPDFGIHGVRSENLGNMLNSTDISYRGHYYFAGRDERNIGVESPSLFFASLKRSVWEAAKMSMQKNIAYSELKNSVIFRANPTLILYIANKRGLMGDDLNMAVGDGPEIFRVYEDPLREHCSATPLEFSKEEQDKFNQACEWLSENDPMYCGGYSLSALFETAISGALTNKVVHELRKLTAKRLQERFR